MTDAQATVSQLWIYPVKSCAGVMLQEATLTDQGLLNDRCWMVVDAHGEMVSQRDVPQMALIQPSLRLSDVVLRAPGMLALHLALHLAMALHLASASPYGGKSVGNSKSAIIVRVDAYRTLQIRNHLAGDAADFLRERTPIGIAKHKDICARIASGAETL